MANAGFFDIIRRALGWKNSGIMILEIEEVEIRSPIMTRADLRSILARGIERSGPITTEVERRSRII